MVGGGKKLLSHLRNKCESQDIIIEIKLCPVERTISMRDGQKWSNLETYLEVRHQSVAPSRQSGPLQRS